MKSTVSEALQGHRAARCEWKSLWRDLPNLRSTEALEGTQWVWVLPGCQPFCKSTSSNILRDPNMAKRTVFDRDMIEISTVHFRAPKFSLQMVNPEIGELHSPDLGKSLTFPVVSQEWYRTIDSYESINRWMKHFLLVGHQEEDHGIVLYHFDHFVPTWQRVFDVILDPISLWCPLQI